MKNKRTLLGIGLIAILATIGLAPIMVDAVNVQNLKGLKLVQFIVQNIQDNLLPPIQDGVDDANTKLDQLSLDISDSQASVDQINAGENLQLMVVPLSYTFDDDVTDLEVYNVSNQTNGHLEKIQCTVVSAGEWATPDTIDVTVDILAADDTVIEDDICDFDDVSAPQTLSNDGSVELDGGEKITLTCTTNGAEEGCSVGFVLTLKLGNDPPLE